MSTERTNRPIFDLYQENPRQSLIPKRNLSLLQFFNHKSSAYEGDVPLFPVWSLLKNTVANWGPQEIELSLPSERVYDLGQDRLWAEACEKAWELALAGKGDLLRAGLLDEQTVKEAAGQTEDIEMETTETRSMAWVYPEREQE